MVFVVDATYEYDRDVALQRLFNIFFAMQDTLEQAIQHFEPQRRRTYQIAGLLSVVLISIDAFAILSADLCRSWVERLVHLANNLVMVTGALALV